MTDVYLCSSSNSTIFTRCCDAAILDREEACPACGKIIPPGRWSRAYAPWRRKAKSGAAEVSK